MIAINHNIEQQQPEAPVVDVNVENYGTLFLFRLNTDAAREWVEENVSEPNWFCGVLAVEHSYARPLAAGMLGDGLILE